jgi:hypothetical protein
MFSARYALRPSMKQTHFVFKGLIYVFQNCLIIIYCVLCGERAEVFVNR